MKKQQIERAKREVKRYDLLERIMETSLKHFNFFTERYPRVFEYTWILEQTEGRTGNAMDIGAGVSALPVILAEDGWNVTTIDYLPDAKVEWGYYDYSSINTNIKSINADAAEYTTDVKYDVIYSVSVVEHMPKKTRRKVFENARKMLNDGGILLMTIDLERKKDTIWNKHLGKVIEKNHGTINDIVKELWDSGFVFVETHEQRGIKGIGTDLLYITAT